MRSSRSGADPLDPGPAGFAHRGLHGGPLPENSLIAIAAAMELGAGIECDLRLTRDKQIVVFHDADCRRMCGIPMRIGQSSLASLGRLSLGGQPIPTLESLLHLIDGRVPVLLEIKVDGDLWCWIAALQAGLRDYGGTFAVMSFEPRLLRLLKTNLPDVRRGLLLRDRTLQLKRRLAMWLADPHFVGMEFAGLHRPWVARLRHRLPVYCWTVRTAEQRAQAEVQADALIWEGDGRPRI
ncbi:MAG TPA: glycerophosphodiester phosphodiesterase family protein [Sphingomicrobium sp.]|nr:glycerophosphodiester phosphodiesterase family protein [Sphingomicrobium sp.]